MKFVKTDKRIWHLPLYRKLMNGTTRAGRNFLLLQGTRNGELYVAVNGVVFETSLLNVMDSFFDQEPDV